MTTSTDADAPLTAALLLGWRVAELYALVDDTGAPASDTLLPAHGSLEPADQLELQLRAAAGVAARAGVTSKGASLEELVRMARGATASPAAAEAFRAQLRGCHVEVQKDLWALDESAGKAYELGDGLSDTYGRVCRAYRRDAEDALATWEDVFLAERIERLKKLLDDLQTRLNAAGVTVVRAQLDAWSAGVATRLRASGLPREEPVREGLRRQTVIWRQLLTGDKSPEAYLDRDARAALHDDLRALIWRRYRIWAMVLAAAVIGRVLAWNDLRAPAPPCSRARPRSASPGRRCCSPCAAGSTSGRGCCGTARWRRRSSRPRSRSTACSRRRPASGGCA